MSHNVCPFVCLKGYALYIYNIYVCMYTWMCIYLYTCLIMFFFFFPVSICRETFWVQIPWSESSHLQKAVLTTRRPRCGSSRFIQTQRRLSSHEALQVSYKRELQPFRSRWYKSLDTAQQMFPFGEYIWTSWPFVSQKAMGPTLPWHAAVKFPADSFQIEGKHL